ncbi:MAG: VCBS repeat-containing protein [Desulfobacterales bacterium]|nr:VCBS repeat-containing protein [Desulfobacterales bacterium]
MMWLILTVTDIPMLSPQLMSQTGEICVTAQEEATLLTHQLAASNVLGAHGVGICDIDADGDADMFIAALAGNEIFWLRNDGGFRIMDETGN